MKTTTGVVRTFEICTQSTNASDESVDQMHSVDECLIGGGMSTRLIETNGVELQTEISEDDEAEK